MSRTPGAGGRRGAPGSLGGEQEPHTKFSAETQLIALPRNLLRKIAVERTDEGWRARIIGFDPTFWTNSVSRTYSTRHMALEAAKAASRACGLPVVAVETIAGPDGPDMAA